MAASKKLKVIKVSPEQEQKMKDEAFLKLTATQRLRIHEQLRKRIWGKRYNSTKLKGLKVVKRPAYV